MSLARKAWMLLGEVISKSLWARDLLKEVPKRITLRDLMDRFPEIAEFRAAKQHKDAAATVAVEDVGQTP